MEVDNKKQMQEQQIKYEYLANMGLWDCIQTAVIQSKQTPLLKTAVFLLLQS